MKLTQVPPSTLSCQILSALLTSDLCQWSDSSMREVVSQYFLLEIRIYVLNKFWVCDCDNSFDIHVGLCHLGIYPFSAGLNFDLLSMFFL